MIEYVIQTLHQTTSYGESLLKDIPDAQMNVQPANAPTIHSPTWIVGHVCVGLNFGATLLGAKADDQPLPADWFELFGPNSKSNAPGKTYPGKSVLVAALQTQSKRFASALQAVNPAVLSQPCPPPVDGFFANQGLMAIFMSTSHPATHWGQLSTWRRLMGYPVLF